MTVMSLGWETEDQGPPGHLAREAGKSCLPRPSSWRADALRTESLTAEPWKSMDGAPGAGKGDPAAG